MNDIKNTVKLLESHMNEVFNEISSEDINPYMDLLYIKYIDVLGDLLNEFKVDLNE